MTQTAPAPRSPKLRVSSRRAAPPTGNQRDVTWYGIPASVRPGGVSPHPPAVPLSWSLVKITPALAKPRTPKHRSHRGTETGAACLSCPFKLQTQVWVSMQDASGSPALKKGTSADSSQPERASRESCCTASSAQGTACTEAQRLGLLACLANSIFKRSLGSPCRALPSALLRKCERLQIARSQ